MNLIIVLQIKTIAITTKMVIKQNAAAKDHLKVSCVYVSIFSRCLKAFCSYVETVVVSSLPCPEDSFAELISDVQLKITTNKRIKQDNVFFIV